jgi:hypothetical protein
MVPGFDQVELQGRPFLGRDDLEASTSAHNNLPFPPQQQFTFSGEQCIFFLSSPLLRRKIGVTSGRRVGVALVPI